MKSAFHITIILLLAAILSGIIFVWILPAKKSISLKELKDYSDGNSVILCTGTQTTDLFWEVIDLYGVDNIAKNIDITGYIPDTILKNDLYNYMDNQFVFIGSISENNDELFIVTDWEIVEEIKRNNAILPFPKSWLNYYEVKIK